MSRSRSPADEPAGAERGAAPPPGARTSEPDPLAPTSPPRAAAGPSPVASAPASAAAPAAAADEASRGILQLAWPLMVSFTMRSLFSFVDTFYAGLLDDPDAAIAAIGLTIPLEFVFIATWVGTSNALTSLLSKAMGAREPERLDQLVRTATRLVTAIVPVFVALGAAVYLYGPRLALEPVIAQRFAIYAGTLVAGTGITSFWSILPDSIVKAHHDTRSTMVAGILSNLANVALNTLFTFGFGWGVFGLALSTVLGRFAGLAYALRRAAALERARRAAWAKDALALKPGTYQRPARTLLALAGPSAAGYLLVSLESTIVAALLASLPDAKPAVAAWSIYFRFATFGLTPLIAGSAALLPFIARAWGARDLDRIGAGIRTLGIAVTAGLVLVVTPLYAALAPVILRALSDDPATIGYGVFALRLAPLSCLAALPMLLVRPLFEGMQRALPGMIAAAARYALLTYPLAYLGVEAATRLGAAPFHGVLVGVVAASLFTSAGFAAFGAHHLRRVRRALAGDAREAHVLESGSGRLPRGARREPPRG